MKKRLAIVWGLTLVTLGSGLVNLLSVIGPDLPERRRLLRESFPLDFIHLSRFVTLLIGFALIVSSFNIYKRKKRAFRFVVVLASLSVLFHLTKGLDYEEAAFSLMLLGILVANRGVFRIKSGNPDLRSGLIRIALAGAVVFSYGVAGFWLLDRREFGINFTVADSIRRMLLLVTFAGDPGVIPHTHYAGWFLNSVYVMTSAGVVYAGFSLFCPVIYRCMTLPRERVLAADIVSKHGRASLDHFKFWEDKSFLFSTTSESFVAYRVAGRFALALGDPVGPEDEIEDTARQFLDFCRENDWKAAFHQTLPDFLPIYKKLGLRRLKIGDDAIVDLTRFTLEGKAMKKIRHRVAQLEKGGVHIVRCEPPIGDDVLMKAKEVSDEWLQLPGRRERGFTLGLFDPHYLRTTPVVMAVDREGQVLAFLNILTSYAHGEATIDLMRRRTDAPNGIMDYLFVKVMLDSRERGFHRFSFGLAPIAGFQEHEEASIEERAIHYFLRNMNFVFSFEGLRQYKAKFATEWEPRYTVYRNPLDLPRLAIALGRVSEVKSNEASA